MILWPMKDMSFPENILTVISFSLFNSFHSAFHSVLVKDILIITYLIDTFVVITCESSVSSRCGVDHSRQEVYQLIQIRQLFRYVFCGSTARVDRHPEKET